METKDGEAFLCEEVFTFEGTYSTKDDRVQDLTDDAPAAYLGNTRKEELCLEFVDNFVKQFQSLFPSHPKLFITPPNEFGVMKFVCTTIRPTQLPFLHLYNASAQAEFVSHHIQYEPLRNPTQVPSCLPSPTFTLAQQTGDCFDMSTLLCSYLVGAGYDAYCVQGIAPMEITLLNRSEDTCTLEKPLHQQVEALRYRAEAHEETIEDMKVAEGKLEEEEYVIDYESDTELPVNEEKQDETALSEANEEKEVYDQSDEEGTITEPSGAMEIPDISVQENVNSEEADDPYDVGSVHIAESNYLKLQRERENEAKDAGSDPDIGEEDEIPVKSIDPLHGQRVHCWVLVRAGKRDVENSFYIEPTTGRKYHTNGSPYLNVQAAWNHKNYWVNMQSLSEDISFNLQSPDDWEFVFIEEGNNSESDLEPIADTDEGAVDIVENEISGEEVKNPDEKINILDLPSSWVRKPILTREAYCRKYGKSGQRTQLFFKSKLESYAEHRHGQGLVNRLTIYSDRARTMPAEVREYFKNRRDKLYLRVRYPMSLRVTEYFLVGRVSGLKMIDEITGRSYDIQFYVESRLDGLLRRREIQGERITETYVDREDLLESRSLRVCDVESGESKSDRNILALPRGQDEDIGITKMKEVFARNTAVNADKDISKRTFQVDRGCINVLYHYGKGKITRGSRSFYKDAKMPHDIQLVGANTRPLKEKEIEREFQEALQSEKDCYQQVRDTEREIQDILSLRKREELMVVLDLSVFEKARLRANEVAKENPDEQVLHVKDPLMVDYLTPFLMNFPDLTLITVEEAEEARNSCLKALKERLLERATIIQCRLDDENAMLAKKQAAFQRSRDHVEGADEEFEKFCSEAMFRIQILEQRLARHEETALQTYAQMDQKLRSDPRISIIRNNHR